MSKPFTFNVKRAIDRLFFTATHHHPIKVVGNRDKKVKPHKPRVTSSSTPQTEQFSNGCQSS